MVISNNRDSSIITDEETESNMPSWKQTSEICNYFLLEYSHVVENEAKHISVSVSLPDTQPGGIISNSEKHRE